MDKDNEQLDDMRDVSKVVYVKSIGVMRLAML